MTTPPTPDTLGRLEVVVTGDAARRHLAMRGRIDETAHLSTRLDAWRADVVVIDTAGVAFVNSIGVREWMRLLRGLAGAGAQVRLERCAEVIIEQINMIEEARGGAEVVSFHAPYQCTGCGHEASPVLDVAEHGDAMRRMAPPPIPCPECGAVMELYEVPERFFSFLVT